MEIRRQMPEQNVCNEALLDLRPNEKEQSRKKSFDIERIGGIHLYDMIPCRWKLK